MRYIVAICIMVGGSQAAAGAPICKAPRVMVVLDKSSSMTELAEPGSSKWEVAKTTLAGVLQAYEGTIDFGLVIYPDPCECNPGTVKVAPGSKNAAAILAKLGAAPPQYGNYTPLYQTLDLTAKHPSLSDPTTPSHVLVITDGMQWCYPHDPATRLLPIGSVTKLAAKGIKTHVVGFGAAVDALVLNKMAVAGGTATSPSCDPAGEDPASPSSCYHHANGSSELLAALKLIAKNVTAETCDGLDNDCNGTVDDGLKAPLCEKQLGVCKGAQRPCGGAAGWLGCTSGEYAVRANAQGSAYQETETLCDGRDNDCDGTVDEGCACVDGELRTCGSGVGACQMGQQACIAGSWTGCAGELGPAPELCDGIDNDCDGTIDEELSRACSTACGAGVERCSLGSWETCDAPLPTPEVCDGVDNDCDGIVDGPSAVCAGGAICLGGQCRTPPPAPASPPVDGEQGCDCKVARAPAGPLPLALGLLLGLFLVGARRRRG